MSDKMKALVCVLGLITVLAFQCIVAMHLA